MLYRRRLTGAILFSFGYVILLLGAAAVRAIGFEAVVWHLWALAVAIGAGTLLVLARTVAARVLECRTSASQRSRGPHSLSSGPR